MNVLPYGRKKKLECFIRRTWVGRRNKIAEHMLPKEPTSSWERIGPLAPAHRNDPNPWVRADGGFRHHKKRRVSQASCVTHGHDSVISLGIYHIRYVQG